MRLNQIILRPVYKSEESKFQELMDQHHYLGSLNKIGNTIWYVAISDRQWVALLSFSAAALKCSVRDRWIGWDFRYQFDRLNLVANNSRFLILPSFHIKNLGSRVLSLCRNRIQNDWRKYFGFPLLLLETFVDPTQYTGTVYKASNWQFVGYTKGFRRTRNGYSTQSQTPKMVFLSPLHRRAQLLLSSQNLNAIYKTGASKMTLSAEKMRSLPDFFSMVPDPRGKQGRRHRISTVLGISAAATLCGMRGYKAIFDWANSLTQRARRRFRCRYHNGKYQVPSLSMIRNVLVRVNPDDLDKALQEWNKTYGVTDESLAIDGKTMCNAIDKEGRRTHIMSVIGHDSAQCYTQKK